MVARLLTPSPRLIELVHHRWSIPILSELHGGGGSRGTGAKFVTLTRRLGVGPESLRRTLSALIDQGWIHRNPGYGHPLRPEYMLATSGLELASACSKLIRTLDEIGVAAEALRKWSLPVTLAMGGRPIRFSEIRRELPGVTARALGGAPRQPGAMIVNEPSDSRVARGSLKKLPP